MFERLKDLSRVVLVPAVALYTLGFVCITGYLARFGIVNFDIINARYLAAGFFPLFGFAAAAALALYLANNLAAQHLVGEEAIRTWLQRYDIYARFAFFSVLAASLLSALLSLGKIAPAADIHEVTFTGLGKYDLVGNVLSGMPLDFLPADVAFITKATVEIICYGVLAAAVCAVVYFAVQWKKRRKVRGGTGALAVLASDNTAPAKLVKEKRPIKTWEWVLVRFMDGAWFAFAVALFIWSTYKLKVATVDFPSVEKPEDLSLSTVFAWLYGSAGACLFAVTWIRNRAPQLRLSLFYENLDNLTSLLQTLILPLAISLFAFGATIFPHIPFAIGGGEPREVTITIKPISQVFRGHEVYLIGESSQFFFVIDPAKGGGAFQVNKDDVEYMETRQMPTADDTHDNEQPNTSHLEKAPKPEDDSTAPPSMLGRRPPI